MPGTPIERAARKAVIQDDPETFPLLTAAALRTIRHKELAQLARKNGVVGWHSLRKAELVAILARVNQKSRVGGQSGTKSPERGPRAVAAKTPNGHGQALTSAQRKIRRQQVEKNRRKDISSKHRRKLPEDRVILMVRDAYWLQASWDIHPRTIERARAALAEQWHLATPVLRLLRVEASSSSQTETLIRSVAIHGAVQTWFMEVDDPPSCFRVEVGYQANSGRFHSLARSNLVTTPKPGSTEVLDVELSDMAANSERIFSMSGGYNPQLHGGELREWLESRLQRPLGAPVESEFGSGARGVFGAGRSLHFTVDAEMIVFGSADPSALVTIGGEPVRLNADGSFAARVPMPDRRQVIPVTANSRDGGRERTIVLAVERNTKRMEARSREPGE